MQGMSNTTAHFLWMWLADESSAHETWQAFLTDIAARRTIGPTWTDG